MDTIAEGGLIFVTLLAVVGVALAIRRRIPHRPTLDAWLVVGAVVAGMIASIWVLQWRRNQQQRQRLDHAIAALDPIQCDQPPPTRGAWRTLYEIECSPDHRKAYLRGAGEHERLSVSVKARGDRLVAVWLPREIPGSDKVYRVWLLSSDGTVIDTIRTDPTMLTVLERPGLASAVKLIATIDAANATAPGGTVVAEAVFRPGAR